MYQSMSHWRVNMNIKVIEYMTKVIKHITHIMIQGLSGRDIGTILSLLGTQHLSKNVVAQTLKCNSYDISKTYWIIQWVVSPKHYDNVQAVDVDPSNFV